MICAYLWSVLCACTVRSDTGPMSVCFSTPRLYLILISVCAAQVTTGVRQPPGHLYLFMAPENTFVCLGVCRGFMCMPRDHGWPYVLLSMCVSVVCALTACVTAICVRTTALHGRGAAGRHFYGHLFPQPGNEWRKASWSCVDRVVRAVRSRVCTTCTCATFSFFSF